MRLPLTSPPTLPAYSFLEYNGTLLPPIPSSTNATTSELGRIYYKNPQTPMCIVGSHEMTGSVVPLKQPFLVCKKSSDGKVEVQGVVKEKILFGGFPKSIVRATVEGGE
jgi:hypothetical protein